MPLLIYSIPAMPFEKVHGQVGTVASMILMLQMQGGRYRCCWRCVQSFGEHRGRLAELLGNGAGSLSEGSQGALPCPIRQRKVTRQQLTQEQKEGIKYLRGARREERPKIKKRTHPTRIQGFALQAVPTGENIPKGIFHCCSATVASLLKTF